MDDPNNHSPLEYCTSKQGISDDTQWKPSEYLFITHIVATNLAAGLSDRPLARVHVALNVDGMITKTISQSVLMDVKDSMEWDPKILLPSERSSTISFKLHASFETALQAPRKEELLCECESTVGELLDRDGHLQLPKFTEDAPCVILRLNLERRVCDQKALTTSTDSVPEGRVRAGLLDMFKSFKSSLFSMSKHSVSASLDTMEAPRIFALIVTIEKYKDNKKHSDIIGCKADGEHFEDYLKTVLSVPSLQIVALDDENATRDAIIQQFGDHFTNNRAIKHGDTMIFFYAGHGTSERSPEGWVSEGNKMEAICPYDANTFLDGKEVYPIHDRVISGLIRKLAFEKGDNIIVIFDSCHSGGATRATDTTLLPRFTQASSHPPPLELDRDIWDFKPKASTRGAKHAIAQGSYRALESHVLLAACRPNEQALGSRSGGLFTSALLKALKGCTLQNTTYSGLFEQLRIDGGQQHPLCLGGHRDRLLFSTTAIRHGETTYKVFRRNNRLYVSAGHIHGVIVGTEFTVDFGTQSSVLKVVQVDAFECMLESRYPSNFDLILIGTPKGASVSNWNHPTLRVRSPMHTSSPSPHFIIIPAHEEADVAIRRDGTKWEFERFDPLTLRYSTRCITVDTKNDRLMMEAPVAISNFYAYLYRSERTDGNFGKDIQIRLNRVGRDVVGPVGNDLLNASERVGGIEIQQAVITDFDAEYCITIENFSEVGLYPYVFYFDPSDYSVQAWYMPPDPRTPPLGPKEKDRKPSVFAYGYGGFGTDPIEFYLPENQTSDSGFLKIFLTNAYVELNSVAQSAIGKMRLLEPERRTPRGIWVCRTYVLTAESKVVL